jgi:hypothetical protein
VSEPYIKGTGRFTVPCWTQPKLQFWPGGEGESRVLEDERLRETGGTRVAARPGFENKVNQTI